MSQLKYIFIFNALYLLIGGVYFLRDINFEFMIYVGVIILLLSLVYWIHQRIDFPLWMLWLFSIWGLAHVLGGAVTVGDGVLFAYRIYPFVDLGGEFYILKYDQVVHGYLYGLVAVMTYHVVESVLKAWEHKVTLFAVAVLVSLGISGLNEIMEYIISLTLENGVGGYDNTMLDMCFNLAGALIGMTAYIYYCNKADGPSVTIGG